MNIDTRIVEMVFENTEFEKGVKTTLSTIEKLKSVMNFTKSADSFEVVEKASKSLNFDSIIAGVGEVKTSFSAWEVFALNAIQRVSDKMFNLGEKAFKALTTDALTSGFQEYETQMNAVQTILANTKSKGSTIDDVNAALAELNTYADKTIYNFTEMTNNIGRFTAAGLSLETSTSAIQGISNLAAVSGSTAQQASTAMYQLSQALSSGALKLQDWNSVVNAGMGGEVFQNALKETSRNVLERAKAYQKLSEAQKAELELSDEEREMLETYDMDVDKIIEKSGTFRESLKSGWISAGVLSETLKKMTVSGANEYLAKTTGITLDNVEAMQKEAYAAKDVDDALKKVAEKLSESGKISADEAFGILDMARTAEEAATKVKTFSQLIDTLKEAAGSGWTQTWQNVFGDFEEAREMWTHVSDVLGYAIGQSADARNAIMQIWHDDGGRDAMIDSFWNLYDTLVSIKEIAQNAWDTIFPPETTEKKASALITLTEKIRDATNTFREFFSVENESGDGRDWTENAGRLQRIFTALASVVDGGVTIFTSFYRVLRDTFGGRFGTFIDHVLEITAAIADWVIETERVWKENDTFYKGLMKIVDYVKSAFDSLRDAFIDVFGFDITPPTFEELKNFYNEAVNHVIPALEKLDGVTSTVQNGLAILSGALYSILEYFGQMVGINIANPNLDALTSFCQYIIDVGQKVIDFIKGIADQISDLFKKLTESKSLDLVGKAFSGLGSMITHIKDIILEVVDVIGKVVESVVTTFGEVAGDNLNTIVEGGLLLAAFDTIDGIVGKVDKLLDKVKDFEKFSGILQSVEDAVEGFVDVIKAYETNINAETLGEISFALIEFAAALLVISLISPDRLTASIAAISAGLTELVTAFALISVLPGKFTFDSNALTGIKSLAWAVLELAVAMYIIGQLPVDQILNAEIVIISLLSALLACAYILSTGGIAIAEGINKMNSLAQAIVILAVAMKIIASIGDSEMIFSATGSIIGLLLALTMVAKTLSNSGDVIMKGVGRLITMSIAVLILAASVKILSSIDQNDLFVGLGGVLTLVTTLVMVCEVLSKSGGQLTKGVGQLIYLAAAVVILTAAVVILGLVPTENLIKGMEAVVTLIVAFTAFSYVVGQSSGNMMNAGIAMMLMAGAITLLLVPILTLARLAALDISSLETSVEIIVVLIGALTAFTVVAKQSKGVVSAATGLLILSVAVNIIANAIASLAGISTGDLIGGVAAISTIIAMISAFAIVMKENGDGVMKTGAYMLIASVAIKLVADAIATIGSIDNEGALMGVMSIVSVLAALILFSKVMTDPGSMLTSGAAMIVMAIALNMMIPILKVLSSLSFTSLAIMAGGLLALFGALALGGLMLKPLALTFMTLSVSFLLFAASLVVVGLSLDMIGGGIERLIKGISAAYEFFKTVLSDLKNVGTSFPEMIDGFMTNIGEIFDAISRLFDEVIPAVFELLGTLLQNGVMMLIDLITQVIGPLIEVVLDFIVNSIVTIANKLTEYISVIVPAIVDLIGTLITTVIDSLSVWVEPIIISIANFIVSCIDGLSTAIPMILEACMNFIISLLNGVTDLLNGSIDALSSAISNLIIAAINATVKIIVALATSLFSAGKTMFGGLIDACKEILPKIWTNIKEKFNDIISNLRGFFSRFKSAGAYIIDGLKQGILDKINSVKEAVSNVASGAIAKFKSVLGIASPSKVFAQLGRWTTEGFSNGVTELAGTVDAATAAIGNRAISGMESAIDAMDGYFTNEKSFNPSITPSLNFNGFNGGMAKLSSLFETTPNKLNDMEKSNELRQSVEQLVTIGYGVLDAIQNGREITIDGKTVIGYVNRQLGKA